MWAGYSSLCSDFRLQSSSRRVPPWIARAEYQRTVTQTRFGLEAKNQQGYHQKVNRRFASGTTGHLEAVEM